MGYPAISTVGRSPLLDGDEAGGIICVHSYCLAANWTTILLGIPAVFLLYGILLAVYRLVFSPLARFPGPKIAAATGWYELYHDVVNPGQYFYRINEFHDKYGMFDGKNHSRLTETDQVPLSESTPGSLLFAMASFTARSTSRDL